MEREEEKRFLEGSHSQPEELASAGPRKAAV
jgi:hypothetical protein